MICNAKNGISSCELSRALGVTQKTAWFMLHRIRLALQNKSIKKLTGEVEVDETYIGGTAHKMNNKQRRNKARGSGSVGKAVIMGLLERKGRVVAMAVPNPKRKTLTALVYQNVEPGSAVFTDALPSYNFYCCWQTVINSLPRSLEARRNPKPNASDDNQNHNTN